ANRTGRDRQELFEQIYSQERYAEQAYQEKKAGPYRECFTNLMQFAQYLEQLQQEYLALVQGGHRQPTRDDVLRALKRLERESIFLLGGLRPSQAELAGRLGRLREGLPALARRADRAAAGAGGDVRKAV